MEKPKPIPISELSERQIQENILKRLNLIVDHQKKIRSRIGTIEFVIAFVFIIGFIGFIFSILGLAAL